MSVDVVIRSAYARIVSELVNNRTEADCDRAADSNRHHSDEAELFRLS
jgi:hypothetical protein